MICDFDQTDFGVSDAQAKQIKKKTDLTKI